MSSREIMNAQGFGNYDKNQISKARKRKLKRIKTKETKEVLFNSKKVEKIKNYYKEGTDIKKLSKHFVEEYKARIAQKKWVENNTITMEEYFTNAKKHKKNSNYKKDSELW